MTKQMNYLETPLPEKTKSYMPVGHKDLIDFVDERLDVAGFKRSSLYVDQVKDGQAIIANMGIEKVENEFFRQQFSFTNSYDKTTPVMFMSGAEVFVCHNGMIVSEAVTVRRHTTNVWNELADKCDEAIEIMKNNWEKTLADTLKMREKELTFTQMSELLGRIYIEKEIVNSTEVNIAAREIKNPTFEDFKKPNMWSLYNACTFALKEAHISRKNWRLKRLHDFCLEVAV